MASSAGNAQYAKGLKKAQCESIETTISERRLLFAGAVQRTNNERLTRQIVFGTMAGGETPGPGRPEKNRAQCLVDDLRVFGAETDLWPTAAKKGGKWYRGVVQVADCFVARWHRDEAESSWLRRQE